ncbi:predicted protein [Naegleria gruberi]|uniref:Predicted protein n=1 Tax=Naegleria gruberi TaxID=5762 RepID=D2VGC3_NAEGR|nr:uncharacterized protein NAEGRDRAFT_79880 [Naegleria gruberi]EFC44042.1 predicted protein [Naegleria gruberi]|eukprot:XP_002676786.1 predicted protein [Naegleria gruberi strain NEG-M]
MKGPSTILFLFVFFFVQHFSSSHQQVTPSNLNSNNLNIPQRTFKNINTDNLFFKTVHLLPHSHWDVGWLKTKQDYYQEDVKPIIRAVLKALSQDSNRKFTFVEMSFIEYFFLHDASKKERQQFIKLLKNSQIELSLAGMTMSDEASNTYSSIIHTLTRGHQFVNEYLNEREFNFLPTNAFRIDPFGSTSTMTRLYKESGLIDQIVMRTPHSLQQKLRYEKKLAFFWKQTDGTVSYSQILDYQYCISLFFDDSSQFSIAPPEISAQMLHEQIVKYSLGFRNVSESRKWKENGEFVEEIRMGSQDILIPAGCDFTFMDASIRFRRIENAMQYINENPQIYPYKVKFSTLGEFFKESKPKEWKDHYAQLKNPKNLKFSPIFDREFMPYSDNDESFWTGFFTSYPILKQSIRKGEAQYRNVKTLLALSAPLRNYSIGEDLKILDELSVTIADLTHHDAITGTSRSFVNVEYLRLLENAVNKSMIVASHSLSYLMKTNDLSNVKCSVEEVIGNMKGSLVVFNSLAWKLTNYVIEISGVVTSQVERLCFFDKNRNRLSTQYVPSLNKKEAYDIHVLIPIIPPLGYTTISVESCTVSLNSISAFDNFTSNNSKTSVSFCETGKGTTLCSYTKNSQNYEFSHHLMRYFGFKTTSFEEQNSGAYIFRPQSPTPELLEQEESSRKLRVHSMQDSNMQIFTQVEQRINNYATTFVRLYNPEIASSQGFDLEYLFKVGELPENEEIIVRFNASSFITSNGEFYCDKNGLETSKFRSRKSPQSSYLPIVYNCFIRDRHRQTRVTFFVSETHGAASLHNGEFEIMLHRRTNHDDNRGVAENLRDASTVVVNVKVRIDQDRSWDEENVRRGILHARESLTNHFKPLIVPIVADKLGEGNLEFSGIAQESKCIHLSNFEMRKYKSSKPHLLLQLQHLGLTNCEIKNEEYPVNLEKMFSNGLLRGSSLNETNLSGSRQLSNIISDSSSVYLAPYSFRTFIVEPTKQYGSLLPDKEYDGRVEQKEDSFWDKLYLTLKILFSIILLSFLPIIWVVFHITNQQP